MLIMMHKLSMKRKGNRRTPLFGRIWFLILTWSQISVLAVFYAIFLFLLHMPLADVDVKPELLPIVLRTRDITRSHGKPAEHAGPCLPPSLAPSALVFESG